MAKKPFAGEPPLILWSFRSSQAVNRAAGRSPQIPIWSPSLHFGKISFRLALVFWVTSWLAAARNKDLPRPNRFFLGCCLLCGEDKWIPSSKRWHGKCCCPHGNAWLCTSSGPSPREFRRIQKNSLRILMRRGSASDVAWVHEPSGGANGATMEVRGERTLQGEQRLYDASNSSFSRR